MANIQRISPVLIAGTLLIGAIWLARGTSAESPDRSATRDAPAQPITVDDLNARPVIGRLGQPLGKIITVSGVIYDEDQELLKAPRGNLLEVTHVNGVALNQKRRIDFESYTPFVKFKKSDFSNGDRFRLVGYEDGGYYGPPSGLFDYVTPHTTPARSFRTQFVILKSELELPKPAASVPRKSSKTKALSK